MIELDLEYLGVVCGGASDVVVDAGADGSYSALVDGRKYTGTGYDSPIQFGRELAGIQDVAEQDPGGQRFEFSTHDPGGAAPYVTYGQFDSNNSYLGSGEVDANDARAAHVIEP